MHEGLPVASRGPEPHGARAVAVMLHARGAGVEHVLGLAEALDDPECAFLAPRARGGSWYPQSFMAPIDDNEPWLSSALSVIEGLIDDLDTEGVPRERIVLGGFSQGACLASEFAIRNPGRWGGLLLFTGGFIGPPGTEWPQEGSFAGTPAFLGTGVPDAWVPVERVRETARILEGMDARVTLREYPGRDHTVNAEELAAGRELLLAVGA